MHPNKALYGHYSMWCEEQVNKYDSNVFFLYQDATYDFSKAILCFDHSLFRHSPFLLFKMLAKLNKDMTL
jgi:hypothetical protein